MYIFIYIYISYVYLQLSCPASSVEKLIFGVTMQINTAWKDNLKKQAIFCWQITNEESKIFPTTKMCHSAGSPVEPVFLYSDKSESPRLNKPASLEELRDSVFSLVIGWLIVKKKLPSIMSSTWIFGMSWISRVTPPEKTWRPKKGWELSIVVK